MYINLNLKFFYNRGFTYLANQNSNNSNKIFWDELSRYYSQRFEKPADIEYLTMIREFISKNSKVLEFGCSSGMNLDWLLCNSELEESNCYGIDISETAIEIASQKSNCSNFQCADLSKSQNYDLFNSGEDFFDLIFTRATLQHIPENELIKIQEYFFRYLKEGGFLVIKEAINLDQKFGKIENHRVQNTYWNNYLEIMSNFNLKKIYEPKGILIFQKERQLRFQQSANNL